MDLETEMSLKYGNVRSQGINSDEEAQRFPVDLSLRHTEMSMKHKSERTKRIEAELRESQRKDELYAWAEEELLNREYNADQIQAIYDVIHNHLHGE